MTDPIHIRLNDADDPERCDKFTAALRLGRTDGAGAIRELVDAFVRYVERHGIGPVFPVEIVSARQEKAQEIAGGQV